MPAQQLPTPLQARLVMDSRKTLSSVRNQNLTGSWSQLYKADHLYLDLSLRNSTGESLLLGHLVSDPSSPIPLQATARLVGEQEEYATAISSMGSFRLPVQSGVYRLELDLVNSHIAVDKLEL